MDPTLLATLAGSSVALLSPYLKKAGEEVAKSAGSAIWNKASEVYQSIKGKFVGKPAAEEALQELAKTPDDPDAQAGVRIQLKRLLAEDDTFAQRLAGLVRDAAHSEGDSVFNTTIMGEVAKFVQIGNVAGDVNL